MHDESEADQSFYQVFLKPLWNYFAYYYDEIWNWIDSLGLILFVIVFGIKYSKYTGDLPVTVAKSVILPFTNFTFYQF